MITLRDSRIEHALKSLILSDHEPRSSSLRNLPLRALTFELRLLPRGVEGSKNPSDYELLAEFESLELQYRWSLDDVERAVSGADKEVKRLLSTVHKIEYEFKNVGLSTKSLRRCFSRNPSRRPKRRITQGLRTRRRQIKGFEVLSTKPLPPH